MKNLSDDRRFLDLLQKWWAGDFRRTDQRELDALTGSDEFRREAFEGFQENSEAVSSHEVGAMRARFEKKYRRQKGRSVPLNWVLAAAAMGLLILATVWLFDGFSSQNGGDVAMKNETQPVENQSVEVAPTVSQPGILTEKPEAKPAADYAISSDKSADFSKAKRQPSGPQKELEVAENSTKNEVKRADDLAVFSEKMADMESGGTVPVAPLPPQPEAKKDLEMAKSAAVKPGKPAKYPADRNVFQNDQNYPTAPQNSDSRALDEQVVSKKKKEEIRSPEPEMGWTAYKNWLSENKKLPEPARLTGIRGEVKLKFYIDKNGQPTQILVVKTPGGGLDAEAVRLLQTGPKWTTERGEVLLSIEF